MSKRLSARAAMLLAVLIAAGYSCDVAEPERFIREPVIKGFSPGTAALDAFVGDTLIFSITAIDPDDIGLDFSFTLQDSVVASGPVWEYVVHDTGLVRVTACASNGRAESYVVWELTRIQPENKPPVIVDVRPPDTHPTIIVGNSIEFSVSAIDPDGGDVNYAFTVNDSIVSASNHFVFYPVEIGLAVVRALVTDGESFVFHEWQLMVNAEPDSLPPGVVVLQSLVRGEDAGELIVEWIAVGDDGMEGMPSHYLVRTASSSIDDEFSWAAASERGGAPAPAPPGEVQSMVVRDLKPAKLVYVAVRAVDAFGNLSPVGNTLGEVTKGMDVSGTVRDAVTGGPIPDIHVWLIGTEDVTDVDGSFELFELPEAITTFRLWDAAGAEVGDYFNLVSALYQIRHNDVIDLWMIPNLTMQSTEYPDFLFFVKSMASTQGVSNYLQKWDFPVALHIPPFVAHGLDYEQIIKEVALEWEAIVGVDFFEFVDEIPEVGVDVFFDGGIDFAYYQVLEADERNLFIRGRIRMTTQYGPASIGVFRRVAAHELGHAIGMAHSKEDGHLMVGGRAPAVSMPTQDEIWLARVMYHIPRGANLDGFLDQ